VIDVSDLRFLLETAGRFSPMLKGAVYTIFGPPSFFIKLSLQGPDSWAKAVLHLASYLVRHIVRFGFRGLHVTAVSVSAVLQ
jgi:hypothetical protein